MILDWKTRWYSVVDMIERFLRLQRQIKCTLLVMEVSSDFTDDDLKAVELSTDVEPLKSAALMVCKKNATIWDSERIMD